MEKINTYTRYVLDQGTAPMVSHYYALSIEDENIIRDCGIELIWKCDELWVMGNDTTEDMRSEIQRAKTLNIPIRYISEKDIEPKRRRKKR